MTATLRLKIDRAVFGVYCVVDGFVRPRVRRTMGRVYARRADRRFGTWMPIEYLQPGMVVVDSASGHLQIEPDEKVVSVSLCPDDVGLVELRTNKHDDDEPWLLMRNDWIEVDEDSLPNEPLEIRCDVCGKTGHGYTWHDLYEGDEQ